MGAQVQCDSSVKPVPGQPAIIRNCPNARLNGQRVICEEYNEGLDEWQVKGDKFPLSVGMSIGAQFLQLESPQPGPTLLSSGNSVMPVPGQPAIIRNCPNARLNGER